MIKPWLYLFVASIFETGWTYSLKYMNFEKFKLAWSQHSPFSIAFLTELFPFLGYIIFGIANIYFLSISLKDIPTATAIAVWTAFSLVLIKITDVFYFKTPTNFMEIAFLTLIVIGIIGLKQFSSSN